MYTTYRELMQAYLASLKGRSGYDRSLRRATQWILEQRDNPTREIIMQRHLEKGHGDFMPGSTQANMELSLQRSAFRWGLYHNVWQGGDPTAGIRKWKTKKRKRVAKFLEIRALLSYFEFAHTPSELRDRALYGIALLTGCRPVEVRTALLHSITPYGENVGCWNKGRTKNGEDHEIPIPSQAMAWLNAWLALRRRIERYRTSPWIFPGIDPAEPVGDSSVRKRWQEIRDQLKMKGLWNYDLRRTMASYLSNELNYPDKKIQAILNHYDGRALSHYCHVSFDALVPLVEDYANWLFNLKGERHVATAHPINDPAVFMRDASVS